MTVLTSEDERRMLIRNTCQVCGRQIRMMIRRGTGLCSTRCEKQAAADMDSEEARS